MNDFLKALKADLQNRQLLPFVALVAVALLAAVGYAVLGGGSSAATDSAALPSAASPSPAGIAVSPANRETAVAETTNGAGEQRKGAAHDPFKLLPGSEKTESSTSTSPPSSSTTTSGSAEKPEPSKAPVEETKTPAKPSKPAKPKKVYRVAALFGIVPAGTAPLTAQLTPYENLKLMTALPSAQQPLLVFRGVTAGGKSASFTLVGEAILHGNGACLPNASQCQAIDLQKDHYEQLEYLTPSGETIVYELRVVSIESKKASAAALKSELRGQKAGRELLRRAGLLEMPFLRESAQTGVLVFAGHGGFPARAHGAAHRFH
ncbi:MAG: hypothetical protein H0X28_13380 [Solirubrobacterales bacterium]|nr:hypothetical protein [Solirubrobacterales bacterium]